MTNQDRRFMARAIQLARLGRYTTDPNPRVGCVLVEGGEIIGEGWHKKTGESHAERIALTAAGEAARGATAYVTLEPCSHHGLTPPCADGLIEAGVSRVIAAMQDPNPLVAGSGLARLRAAGISTDCGLLEAEAAALNPGFIRRMGEGLPLVRCKLAMSLDGRTAMASGESKWITGEAARRDVQRLRAGSSAVLTGIDTVLADDPGMNLRLSAADLPGVESEADLRQPLRVVVDSNFRMPATAHMLSLAGETLIVTGDDAPHREVEFADRAVTVLRLPLINRRINLRRLLKSLAERQINEVLIEAGPTLAGAALQAGLIDQLIIYQAPHLMGGEARGLFNLPGLSRMADRVDMQVEDIRMVGSDLRITTRPVVKH